jgi:hypothetical protein
MSRAIPAIVTVPLIGTCNAAQDPVADVFTGVTGFPALGVAAAPVGDEADAVGDEPVEPVPLLAAAAIGCTRVS